MGNGWENRKWMETLSPGKNVKPNGNMGRWENGGGIIWNLGKWWELMGHKGNKGKWETITGKKIRGEMSTKKWTGNTSIREGNEGHEMKWVYIFKYFKYTMDLKRDHSMGIFSFGKSASEMDVSWIVMVCLKTLGVKHPDYIKLGPPGKMDRLNLYRQPPNRSRCWKIGGGPHLSSKWSPFWVKQHPDHQVLWIPRWLPVYVICRGWVSLVL